MLIPLLLPPIEIDPFESILLIKRSVATGTLEQVDQGEC
jgi:hypothetical protein